MLKYSRSNSRSYLDKTRGVVAAHGLLYTRAYLEAVKSIQITLNAETVGSWQEKLYSETKIFDSRTLTDSWTGIFFIMDCYLTDLI